MSVRTKTAATLRVLAEHANTTGVCFGLDSDDAKLINDEITRLKEALRHPMGYVCPLPYGHAFPVGDQNLWQACALEMRNVGGDIIQRYADARGISRQQAKNETFTLRYGVV